MLEKLDTPMSNSSPCVRPVAARSRPAKFSDWGRFRSGGVVELSLVPDGKNADLLTTGQEPVQRHVPGAPEGDHQLADLAVDAPPDQRVLF